MLNGQTIFEREQAFGGQQLTQDMVRLYGLTPEEAEIKKRVGDLPENYPDATCCSPSSSRAPPTSRRALQFFFTSTPYTRVDQIYLAGGSSRRARPRRGGRASAPQVPTEILVPFQGMEIADTVRERQLRARCAGAADRRRAGDAEVRRMIRINLLPHREMRRERRKKDFIGLLCAGRRRSRWPRSPWPSRSASTSRSTPSAARNDFIQAENVKLDEQIKEIATLRAEIEALRARQHAVESLQSNRTIPVHLMDELVKHTARGALPEDDAPGGSARSR